MAVARLVAVVETRLGDVSIISFFVCETSALPAFLGRRRIRLGDIVFLCFFYRCCVFRIITIPVY